MLVCNIIVADVCHIWWPWPHNCISNNKYIIGQTFGVRNSFFYVFERRLVLSKAEII